MIRVVGGCWRLADERVINPLAFSSVYRLEPR
jgi:hypothetical protein